MGIATRRHAPHMKRRASREGPRSSRAIVAAIVRRRHAATRANRVGGDVSGRRLGSPPIAARRKR